MLPLTSYRQPAWNHGHKVLDPLGRYLPLDYVAGDDLYVDGRRVAGEDRRARSAAAALRLGDAGSRAAALAALGIGFVVTEHDAGPAPAVDGEVLLDRPLVQVQRLERPRDRSSSTAWIVAVTGPGRCS